MTTLLLHSVHNYRDGHQTPLLDLQLTWDHARPTDITMTVRVHGHPGHGVDWLIGRDLLAAGLDHPAGLGDVTILPDLEADDGQGVEIVLSTPSGRCAIKVPTEPIRRFLACTWEQVPAGAEQIPWDITDLAGGLA